MQTQIHRLSLRDLSAELAAGRLTAREITAHYLERIERLDPKLNAFVHVDADGALTAADAADARRACNRALGPLDGVPVAVKDNLLVAGMPCVWGSRAFEGYVPDHDELVIAVARRAGLVILGKTNVPEFTLRGVTTNPVFGSTGNPWDPALTPGGSSGGSVAAVAAGLAAFALGTDGGGSIRRPAGFTGLVGLKPSIGRIARAHGLPPLLADCEVVGPITRRADDMQLAMSVLAGAQAEDLRSHGFAPIESQTITPANSLRILYVPQFGTAPVDPEIGAACAAAATTLAEMGHSVEIGALPLDMDAVTAQWGVLANTALALMARGRAGFIDEVSAPFADQIRAGEQVSGTDYLAFQDVLTAFREDTAALFEDYDVIITPSSAANPWPRDQQFPPEIDGKPAGPRGHAVFTNWVNACGHPGIGVPAGRTEQGLPIGMQLVGAFGADALLIGLAQQLETRSQWADLWPAAFA